MSMITRSNVEAVMEPDVIREIMEGVVTQSKALSMFRRLPNMSSNKTKMRVLDALPMAYWIDAETNNGRKQLTKMAWENKFITAEEIAVIIPIKEDLVDDVDFDLWADVKPRLVEAFGRKIDDAIFTGTDKPKNFRMDLLSSVRNAGATVTQGADETLYSAINNAMVKVEESGYSVTGMRDSFDGEPLYGKTFKIWFSTPDGFVDYDEPAEIIHNEDKEQIRFCWQLEAKHSRVEGKITFALEITDDTGYEWNTKEAELTVEKGFIKNGTVPPIERGWVNQCITDSAEAITLAKATASQTANLTAKVNSIFASFAVSDYIKGITVGMVISPLFPVKFNTWSVHRGETELASGLNPTAAFITPSAIFKQQDDETITVKFHTDKITIVTELEIVNQYDTSIWGVLEFTEFVSN